MRALGWVGLGLVSMTALVGGAAAFAQSPPPKAPSASAPSASAPSASASTAKTVAPVVVAPAAWSDAEGFPAVTSEDPMWGSRSAPVTIVVFSDLQCPFCAKLNETLVSVKRKFGAEKVRIVFKHNPLSMHKEARAAAITAESVFRLGGSGAFFQFADQAFADRTGFTPANFSKWAQSAGVEPKKITSAVVASAEKKVDADLAEGQLVGVNGTPTSFVNGVEMPGSQTAEALTKKVEEELVRTSRIKGVPRERLYVHMTKSARLKAQIERAKKKP